MDQAQEFLTHFSGPMGYAIFYLIVAACGCGFPFNSDITLITTAVLCANGIFQIWIVMPLAFFALLTGDTICFFVARNYGLHLIKVPPFRWVLSERSVNQAMKLLEKHGRKFLFTVRFLPLIRTALFFTAGTLRVPPRTFYLMNGIATLIYIPTIMLSSYYASANIDLVLQTLKKFQFGLLGILVAVILFLAIRKKKTSTSYQE